MNDKLMFKCSPDQWRIIGGSSTPYSDINYLATTLLKWPSTMNQAIFKTLNIDDFATNYPGTAGMTALTAVSPIHRQPNLSFDFRVVGIRSKNFALFRPELDWAPIGSSLIAGSLLSPVTTFVTSLADEIFMPDTLPLNKAMSRLWRLIFQAWLDSNPNWAVIRVSDLFSEFLGFFFSRLNTEPFATYWEQLAAPIFDGSPITNPYWSALGGDRPKILMMYVIEPIIDPILAASEFPFLMIEPNHKAIYSIYVAPGWFYRDTVPTSSFEPPFHDPLLLGTITLQP